ncbi:MAG: hypothetical protein Q7T20_07460 [Saprospiraceae bacterium]|nr:hypothetical protein [Saprospiraceae bacterium]
MKKENLDDELKAISPFLKEMKGKGDSFKVPEGYFEDLEDAVFARLESSGGLRRPKIKAAKRPGLFAAFIRPPAAMAYAAAMALILAAVWFIRQDVASVQEVPHFSTELTEDDLESYVLENLHEFDPEQLAALTPEVTSKPIERASSGKMKKNSSASDEIHPDDLDKILDEMTDEELEQIL